MIRFPFLKIIKSKFLIFLHQPVSLMIHYVTINEWECVVIYPALLLWNVPRREVRRGRSVKMLYSQDRFLLFINPESKLSLFPKKREVNLKVNLAICRKLPCLVRTDILMTWCELIFSFSPAVRVAAWYSVRLLGWWWVQQAMCSTARPQTRSSHDQRPALCNWNR